LSGNPFQQIIREIKGDAIYQAGNPYQLITGEINGDAIYPAEMYI